MTESKTPDLFTRLIRGDLMARSLSRVNLGHKGQYVRSIYLPLGLKNCEILGKNVSEITKQVEKNNLIVTFLPNKDLDKDLEYNIDDYDTLMCLLNGDTDAINKINSIAGFTRLYKMYTYLGINSGSIKAIIYGALKKIKLYDPQNIKSETEMSMLQYFDQLKYNVFKSITNTTVVQIDATIKNVEPHIVLLDYVPCRGFYRNAYREVYTITLGIGNKEFRLFSYNEGYLLDAVVILYGKDYDLSKYREMTGGTRSSG